VDAVTVMATRGDLRHLALDAWLLPTDYSLYVHHGWREGDEDLRRATREARRAPRPPDWSEHGRRVLPLRLPDRRRGVPVLAAVPDTGTADWEYHRETLRQFVELASRLPRPERPQPRARRLLGVPLLGTGHSTSYLEDHGTHLAGLLEALEQEAEDHDVDLVLVVKDEAAFAAVQAVRRRRRRASPPVDEPWADDVVRLAQLARKGALVLFTGAGTGVPAGLPDWDRLLRELAVWAGVPTASLKAFDDMTPLDRGAIVAGKTSPSRMAARIAQRLTVPHVSLAHTQLAAPPVQENVTLNYDECFEQAAADAGAPVAVLPYEPAGDRWLLKLHGCVHEGRREDIVLTRGDYLDLGRHRASLTGLVQALLVTRHMLFVGFGLGDDHFHSVVHDVKRALDGAARKQLGTVLVLQRDPLQEELWGDDLTYVHMSGDVGKAARELEVFLDRLLLAATTSDRHLFDDRYASLLEDPERDLAQALQTVAEDVDLSASSAGARVLELLREFGLKGPETVGPR
jgi:hypothetical protein